MQNFKVSVVIPCFNGWRYMEKCLASLENQTIKPYEIIVVDDCSTDDSYEKLVEYSKATNLKFIVIKNERNGGPGVSREKAIKEATGDYLAFCDCDDWYELEFIEIMTRAIMDNDSDIAICDNYMAYDDRKVVLNVTNNLKGASKEQIIAEYTMSLCRLVVLKKLFDGIECPPIYNGEDGAVVPQILAKAKNISVVDKPLYNYYFREGSASNNISKKVYLGMLEAFKSIENIKEEYPKECEFLGIKTVCYASLLTACKAKIQNKVLRQVIGEFNKSYPNWKKNCYYKTLAKSKRIFLFLVRNKMFLLAKLFSKLHSIYIRKRK